MGSPGKPDRGGPERGFAEGQKAEEAAGQTGQGSSASSSGPPSRRGASQAPTSPKAEAPMLSLRGILAARRLTQELKNRTSMRTQLELHHRRPICTIQEQVWASSLQVPSWSARPEVKFLCVQAEELMQAHLPSKLAGVAYHPGQCAHLTAVLSAEIRDLVKHVTPPRYKLVCSVSIGSKGHDDVVVSSQSLWDPYADRLVTSHYANPTLFCVALVHAFYLE